MVYKLLALITLTSVIHVVEINQFCYPKQYRHKKVLRKNLKWKNSMKTVSPV